MKLLVLFFFFYITSAYSQQTIDKLNSNQLKLPKESVSKALILDATGQVKSSSTITDTELSYLDGLTNTITSLLSGKANDTDVVKLTTDQSISGTKTFTGKLVASSTVNGSVPCPVMTETQRNAFTAAQGDCVFNSTSLKLTIYDGAVWKDAGGAGGVSLWLTANPYIINDVVIESDRIYRCLVAHTSGTFATDLAASRWVEVSASPATPYSLANGGTNKALTASNGGVVWVDADSFEILAPGTSGQVLQSNAAASPSWVNKSVSGKADSSAAITLEEIQVANNQLTQTATNKYRVELGNKNILVNPSFEHSTFSTGWTNSAGTFTEETAIEIDGLKAAKLVLSAQTMSLTQSSTLYASQFADGVQGLAMVRVKSDVALKVCAIQAGVVSTSLCIDVPAHNKWGLYKVPFILGATSNGISIASTGNVTGTVYLDDGFLGAVDLKQEVSGRKLLGTITISGCGGNYSTTSASYVSMGVLTGCTYATTGIVQSPATQLPGFRLASVPSGALEVIARGAFGKFGTTTNSDTYFRIQDTTNSLTAQDNQISGATSSGIALTSPTIGGTLIYASSRGQSSFEIFSKSSNATGGAAIFIASGPNTTGGPIYFEVWSTGDSSTYSSTNADTDWASCGHTPSSFNGFGTATNITTECKRQGSDLLMRGRFTAGVRTGVPARVALPIWNGVQLTSKAGSQLEIAEDVWWAGPTTNAPYSAILEVASSSYFGIGFQGNNPYSIALANAIGADSTTFGVNVRIPIAGWQNSNIIIGQFNGLESCTDSYECTDTFSAKISATGVVSGENIDWISGNCSDLGASLRRCTFKTSVFTISPVCTASVNADLNGGTIRIFNELSTSFDIRSVIDNVSNTANPINIICQKQGVGKTAKAVASDQNLRTPGVTKAVMYSAKVSATGVVSSEFGDLISGNCTASSPYTCTLTSSIFDSIPNCWASGIQGNNTTIAANPTSTTSVTVASVTDSGVAANSSFTLVCHGVSP